MPIESGEPEHVSFPDGYDLACEVVGGFERFLKVYPDDESRAQYTFISRTDNLSFIPPVDHDDAELGYFRRTGRKHTDPKYDRFGGVYDRKHCFHFAPRYWRMLQERDVHLTDEVRPWLSHCHRLFVRAQQVLYAFAAKYEEKHPESRMLELLRTGERGPLGHCHVLRLLRYARQENRTPLGHEHTDRDTLSLEVAQSWPALYGTKLERLWETPKGEALIFAGDKAKQQWGFEPFAHSVFDPTNRSLSEERWAIVFFGHHFPVPSP